MKTVHSGKGSYMKRIIVLVLIAAVMLGICGCGSRAGEDTQPSVDLKLDTFSVGYSRIDITPNCSVPMAGYGATSKRMSQNIQDYLYATAVAIHDGQGGTLVFLNVDLQRASDVILQNIRPQLAKMTGLPENAFHLNATHTHSGPDVQSSNASVAPYLDVLFPRLIQVVLEALEDLKPATMWAGSIETEGLNFVRHYYHVDENGEKVYFGDNHGTSVIDTTTAHASKPDETMYVVKFQREDAKDVCMVNWRAHPHWTGGSSVYNISSDYVGAFREAFELQTDCLFSYWQGAAGNINEKSRITSENLVTDYKEHGARLAQYAIDCLNENMEQLKTGAIRIGEKTLALKVNKTDDVGLYYAAKTVQTIYNKTNNRTEALAAAGDYKIWSQYHAGAIVNNSERADTEERSYTVVSIGDQLVITLAPHEMFDSTMQRVEEAAGFDYTLHFSYSNGTNSYMPDAATWEFGSYEVDTALFVEGSAELVEKTLMDMIAQIDDQK